MSRHCQHPINVKALDFVRKGCKIWRWNVPILRVNIKFYYKRKDWRTQFLSKSSLLQHFMISSSLNIDFVELSCNFFYLYTNKTWQAWIFYTIILPIIQGVIVFYYVRKMAKQRVHQKVYTSYLHNISNFWHHFTYIVDGF